MGKGKTCKKYNVRLNHKKTIHSVPSIKVVGFIIGNESVKPDPERFRLLVEISAPSNITEQRRVVRMFAYYSKWVQNFSDKIRILNQNKTFPLPDDA